MSVAVSKKFEETADDRPLHLRRVAAVLPRYGASLGGGAEALVRSLVLKLAQRNLGGGIVADEVEVWTTCATDHRTWENALPAGSVIEDGILVRRFTVEPRDIDTFLKAEFAMRDGLPLSTSEQLAWLSAGVNSKGLYEHIVRASKHFDAVLFAPYLFPITFWGSLLCPEKAVLIPCLHNEQYAYQPVMREMFARARGLLFNAEPEMELAADLYGRELIYAKGAVVGMGFVTPPKAEAVTRRPRPYLLYSGRKEQGKNLEVLLDWYENVRLQFPEIDLVLIGSGKIEFLASLPLGVVDLGFVSEQEKLELMRGALALCQPSVNESFSIVLMEAWMEGCPVIVHSNCPVTRHHVVKSGGGFYCENSAEFLAIVKMLQKTSSVRQQMANAGRRYVAEVFSWQAVLYRLRNAFIKIGIGEKIVDATPAAESIDVGALS